jgi:hypothetical protein
MSGSAGPCVCPWFMRKQTYGRHAAPNKGDMGNDNNVPATVLIWLFGKVLDASGESCYFLSHSSAHKVQASLRLSWQNSASVLGVAII